MSSIELSVQERLGIDRLSYPVTMGVPFPEGGLRSCDELELAGPSGSIALQTRSMLTWPDGSVKWALLDFQADLPADRESRFTLSFGAGAQGAGAGPAETGAATPGGPDADNQVSVEPLKRGLRVTTGPLAVDFGGGAGFPFTSVTAHGTEVLPAGNLVSDMVIDGVPHDVVAAGEPVVEEQGPLRSVVAVPGIATAEDGSRSLEFIARVYLSAGSATLRVFLTVTNKVKKRLVHIDRWTVSARPALRGDTEAFITSSVSTGWHQVHVDKLQNERCSFKIEVGDAPFEPWKPETHGMEDQETPERPQRARREYEVVSDGRSVAKRNGADWHTLVPAAAVLGSEAGTFTLMVRHPWYNAPKEVSVDHGTATIDLYPSWADPLEFHRGVAKTHELFLDFSSEAPDETDRVKFACGVERRPAPQIATPNWIADSGAVGALLRYQPEKYRWWEYVFGSVIKNHTFNTEADPSMGAHFLNYGDYWRDRRGGQWLNNEMDKGFALLLQMMRKGNTNLMEPAEAIIHHQIDVDTIHDADEEWWIGAQRYHFAKHGVMRGPALCHEWIDGPLFYYLLTGYKRAEEIALARAEHFCRAVDRGAHRAKTLARVAGYPLLALSRMYENYRDPAYRSAASKVLDWLEEWYEEDGGLAYDAFSPPGTTNVVTGLSNGIVACALMRHNIATGEDRSYSLLKRMADDDLERSGLTTPEGFFKKTSSTFRDYYAPEPDFYFEALAYLTERTGERRYADIAYVNMQRLFVGRRMISEHDEPPHFMRYWLPYLARADELGMLGDPKPF